MPIDFHPARGFAPRIVTVIDSQIGAIRDLLFGAQTGQADLRVGGLQEFDSVSTRHPPRSDPPEDRVFYQ